ncbi:hypothetical protein [Paenibacillus larvae]|nr:hypothetical protein [Paenibacillus larvae]MCY9503243.1 hypothetical protein [Paenibacillus larvae]MCY9526825.1 hypothetical protein [Paenibacillus larvae]MCY9679647.1 hypothetical protein [Paenibacillus larvae]MCY9747567.1 hypothetical protein [Paenibacillus larvae]MCY9750781.1 hypothetical protein [Paenibacillus larvae]
MMKHVKSKMAIIFSILAALLIIPIPSSAATQQDCSSEIGSSCKQVIMNFSDHDAQSEALYLTRGTDIQYWFDSSSSSKHLVNVGVIRYPDYYLVNQFVV